MAPAPAAKVAIIGGGCAAITTAFELTRPEMQGRFDVTVYQVGWRLGGKGASGRGASGRIEEHGLHIWLGCYDNAFRVMRQCYGELGADWTEAFIPEDAMGVTASSGSEGWHNWSATFPPQPGLPGDPLLPGELLSPSRYIARAIDLLRTLILRCRDLRLRSGPEQALNDSFSAAATTGDPHRVVSAIGDLIGGGIAVTGAVLAEALALLQAGLEMLPSSLANPLTDLADWIAHSLRRWLEVHVTATPRVQHLWEMMDIVVATIVGILRFGLLGSRGFDPIDEYDWREWLLLSGASRRAAESAFVRGIYDLLFSYQDGDPDQPRLAAGVALRGTLRMFFGYRGALYWRMRAGMGDVVFAPLYEVLRRRGVKFAFFHRLRNVRLAAESDLAPGERPFVTALEFDIQANVRDGADYAPLVDVKGRPCWPASPDFSQLEDGERMAREGWDFESHWDDRHMAALTLDVTKDFDFVVLGVGLGAVPHVCGELVARNPRWNRMAHELKTNAIQSFQVWLDHDLGELGWNGEHLIGTGFSQGFEGWAEMAHTIPEEAWAERPRTVLYFCGPLPDPPTPGADQDIAYPRRRNDEVFRNAVTRLRETARHLWPKATDAGGEFRWDMLRDAAPPEGGGCESAIGEARFRSQYWRANVNPTDRYVLSTPGSTKYRISPLDMTYDNLTIAGDWTESGLNVGCVESAVMSGLLAAHALSGSPILEDIIAYDHP